MKKHINGILLLYHHSLGKNASTIDEHISAFCNHSKFNVVKLNTALPFPASLSNYSFSVIILHYTLFGLPINLSNRFAEYISNSTNSYKIAFFQDEYRFWNERAEIINKCEINCVYTLLEPAFFDMTYRAKCPKVSDIYYTLPGYVNADAETARQTFLKPEQHRTVDIGYRGRRLPYYLGRGSQEKHIIGMEFKKRSKQLGLIADIETKEKNRIYGKAWPRFIANCKAVLGVEAGVSVFDLDGSLREAYSRMCSGHPDVSFPQCGFEAVHNKILAPYEDKIYYRTISPRHFEAANLMVCQILFEGKYSKIMEPMKHYIPLKKDFSNFDEVIKLFMDVSIRKNIAQNAFDDLIKSGSYSYKNFISEFDTNLNSIGIYPCNNNYYPAKELNHIIFKQKVGLRLYRIWAFARHSSFPGREQLKPIIKPFLDKFGI